MKPIDLGLIVARRKKIEAAVQAEYQRHNVALAELEDELEELTIAERVFSKLSDGGPAPTKQNSEKGGGKPTGLPPMTEMIKEALVHGAEINRIGLTPANILSYVRGKYWQGAQPKDVGPIAWRMAQNGQIRKFKSGGIYGLLEKDFTAVRQKIEQAAKQMPPPSPTLPPDRG